MTPITELLAGAEQVEGGFRVAIPVGWLQGRTAYGGLSSALALHAAQRSDSDLPPLRSALIAFVGPLAGEVTVTAQRLRRGRNAAYVEASIASEAGVGFRGTFVFMRDVESTVAYDASVASAHAPPAAGAPLYIGKPEYFTHNFEFFDLKHEAGPAEWLRWVRLREREGLDPETELMAIGDALPPAALKLLGGPAPVSSLTWQLNLLRPRPTSRDGWWLLHARTERAIGSYSSQRMTISDADGAPVADAMQGVAVFA
jgi:acyl-CoA thioesterase